MFSFYLFSAVFSVRQEKYTKCTESYFCTRDRSVTDQVWSIQPNTVNSNKTTFTAIIDDVNYSTKLSLKVSIHHNKTAHIKVKPLDKESFNRYDCELEPTVINQEYISSFVDIQVENTDSQSIISAEGIKLIVNYNPFSIVVNDEKGEALLFNMDNAAVFETQRSKEKYPDLFKDRYFNGFNDVFKNGPTSVAMSFRFNGKQTRLTGLPAHTLPLTLENTSEPIRFFNTDINEFEIGNGMSMYGAVPLIFMHSLDRSIGLFWCNPSETWVDIKNAQDRSSSDARYISEGGYIDIYVFLGSPSEISNSYTSLTGRPQLTPLFALAYHQCRWGYMTQSDFLGVSTKLDEIGVPHDVMWLDLDHTDDKKYFTFHPSNFPEPKKMLETFAKDQRYVVTLVDPHLKADGGYNVYNQANSQKLLVKTRDGSVYRAKCWPGDSVWPDFFMPKARAWWESLFSFKHYSNSASNLFVWNDMNEISVFDAADNTAPRDLVHYGDIEEREIHNMYGHMMIGATFGGLRKRDEKPMRPFILSRSFFAGSQKYAYVWSGDNAADWNHLKNSIPSVLSFGLGGIVYSGADIGGFFNSPDEDLLSRWYSIAAWTYTFFREHCHHLASQREIYLIKDDKYRKLAKTAVIERYTMLPYWYTLAKESNATGKPLVRPLWYEFTQEESVLDIDDQVMLGDKLMVIPFIEKEQKDRNIVLPNISKWYEFRTLQPFEQTVAKFTDGNCLVLIKGGSIVPMKCRVRKSSKLMFYDPFTLVISADENGAAEGKLYIDDGESEEFEKGSFIYRQFSLENGKLSNRAVPPRVMNEFGYKYDNYIERIRISGIKEPQSITGPNGRMEFEYEEGVLTIRKPGLLVRDDWSITFQ
ncbi:Glycosyl hydrolases family 31 protein [Trichomonas vaginalis G3]|uniref:Glucosidase II subunit alpha n=1 Tax=Trichomonas vaginalis (strain ATCC PRA-98 / G3) TaxID=412133 RepID=A2DNT4_TRIV3|nr:glycosyl hydrolase [Trichomonas vaginalis G3]EAY17929.1 Glycosyl hydrolases family 31 protein [Trichomonas vaginalis G3]KAI5527106.1 alpha-glucosidase family [Trichomonas vaginalis G3]|eukprot:XP_001578915.1 glycosyl hydrolase [Trichomonas vaginalis G3]